MEQGLPSPGSISCPRWSGCEVCAVDDVVEGAVGWGSRRAERLDERVATRAAGEDLAGAAEASRNVYDLAVEELSLETGEGENVEPACCSVGNRRSTTEAVEVRADHAGGGHSGPRERTAALVRRTQKAACGNATERVRV